MLTELIRLFTIKFWKLEGRNGFPDSRNPVVAVFSHFPFFPSSQLIRYIVAAVETASSYNPKMVKVNGKAVPLQAWSCPEASRKLRFPDFMTTAQEAGKFVSPTPRPHLPPGNSPGTHFC